MARTEQLEHEAVSPGPTRFALRRMTEADIPQVMDIERDSFPSMWPKTAYSRELKNKLARYFVLVEKGREEHDDASAEGGLRKKLRRLLRAEGEAPPTRRLIIGAVGIWLMVDQAHVVTIAVREAFRRQGAAGLMLIATVELAMVEGMDSVTLEYRRSSEPARALYDRFGFLAVGARPQYYSDTKEDAIIMTTPPLRSKSFQEKFLRLKGQHERRWGETYGLPESYW